MESALKFLDFYIVNFDTVKGQKIQHILRAVCKLNHNAWYILCQSLELCSQFAN